jgi:dolichol kinase
MLWTAGGFLAAELVGAAIIGAAFLAIFGIAELWSRLGDPPVEWTRKFVHFFGGLIAATFPWVFQSRWTVVGLAGLFTFIIWATRRFGLLSSVHGVERKSQGGIFFPVAILLVFVVGRDQPVFYLIAILALVVSDTLAALVGSTYGRQGYAVETDRRSVEGSVVFFLTTFLVTHLPLLLMAGLDPMLSVLISLQVAIIVTQFEAISLRGNDNLLIPVATFYLLLKMTPRGVDHIAGQLLAQLAIIGVIAVVVWRVRPLTLSGGTALMLFAYGAWALGGPEWIVAPTAALLGFLAVRLLFARDVLPTPAGRYQVIATFYVCIVATILLIANNTLETLIPGVHPAFRWADPFYVPFVGVVAAQIALIVIAQLEPFRTDAPARVGPVIGSAVAAYVLVVPLGLAVGPHGLSASGLLLTATAVALALGSYLALRRLPAWPHAAPWHVRLQALAGAIAAVVVVPVELWRLGVL